MRQPDTLRHAMLPPLGGVLLALTGSLMQPALGQDGQNSEDLLFSPTMPGITDSPPAAASPATTAVPSSPAFIPEDHGAVPDARYYELTEDIARYQTLIDEAEAYDRDLSQTYMNLGNAHQQRGDLEDALTAYSQAMQVIRANSGLQDPQQTPVLRKIVETHLAAGDITEANEQQQHLIYLQQKNHGEDSPELLPTLNDYADWNLAAASLNLGFNPDIRNLQSEPVRYFDRSLAGTISSEETLRHLQRAQQSYARIRRILLSQSEEEIDPRLPETEKKLALTYFVTAYAWENLRFTREFQARSGSQIDNVSAEALSNRASSQNAVTGSGADASFRGRQRDRTERYYDYGRNALVRRLIYLDNTPGMPLETKVNALVDLGDWYLLSRQWDTARYVYESSRNLLQENGIAPGNIDGLVAPGVPVRIPSFISPRFSRNANNIPQNRPVNYQGYIDVEFDVNRFGNANNARILATSEGTREQTERVLLEEIEGARFRLQLAAASATAAQAPEDAARQESFRVRYYYTNQPE